MGLDHVGVNVPKALFEEVLSFYLAALAPLDYKVIMRPHDAFVGLGKDVPDWWVAADDIDKANTPIHVAFGAADRHVVDEFYKVGLAAGGKDNGGPGLRPEYHPNFYAAFLKDPVGNNVEVVCHDPPQE